jgi:hypothetical protein
MKENICIGDIIETDGFLLEYAQIYKPFTHVNGMGTKASFGEEKKKFVNGKLVDQNNIVITYQAFQPPVQKIPNYNGVGCAFLYDTRFKGYILESNPDEVARKEKQLCINEYSKPILLLYDLKYRKHLNKEVSLRARVIDLPGRLAEAISGIHSSEIQEICSNFIDLYSESKNFICLTVLDDSTGIKDESVIENLGEFIAPIFVEAQLGGLNTFESEEVREIIQSIIPNSPQRIDPWCPIEVLNTNGDNAIPFVSMTDTNLILRNNVVGFYTQMNLFEDESYRYRLDTYSRLIKNFSVDYSNLMKKEFGCKESMKLTFLYDYNKQALFDHRGVLYSRESEELVKLDDPNKYVIEWLKQG